MRIIQKGLKLKPVEYYRTHLGIINALLVPTLTNKEIEVLAEFLALDKSLIAIDVFNTYARKQVRHNLELSAASLSNHISSLISKKYLSRDKITGILEVSPLILPEDDWQGYQFKIVKDV